MARSVLIQKERGEFLNVNGFNAWQGFTQRGYEIRFATWAEMISTGPSISAESIVVGSVDFVRHALEYLGIDPPPIDYPPSLNQALGRRVWLTSLGEIRSRVDDPVPPVFIKPAGADKAFPGQVVGAYRDLIPTRSFPADTPVWASETVEFASEWRFFVQRGGVIGVGHYKGDALRFPDPVVALGCLATFLPDAPVAYALDLGVTTCGATRLVEVNDGFSLGCYGLGPLAYSSFLQDRWDELVGNPVR